MAKLTNNIKIGNLLDFKSFNPNNKECLTGTEYAILFYILNKKLRKIVDDPSRYNGNTIEVTKPFKTKLLSEFNISAKTYEQTITKLVKGGVFWRISNSYYLVNPYAFYCGEKKELIEKLEIFRTSTADLDDKTEMFLKKRNEKIAFSRNEKIEYKSNAELRIAKFLENEKIEFEYQYTDPDCKDIKELPYDFAIKYKEKIICFVESDGEHHFRPIKRTKEESNEESIERLETIRKHDRIKDENAVNKNIPIIRIPYWLFEKIEIILAKELTKLTILN